jgi:hypothetical protein
MQAVILLLVCVLLHITTIALLALRCSQLALEAKEYKRGGAVVPAASIRGAGMLTSILTFVLPYCFNRKDELTQCQLRVVCFFYGCKILDLALYRAEKPPRLLADPGTPNRRGEGRAVGGTENPYRLCNIQLAFTCRDEISKL